MSYDLEIYSHLPPDQRLVEDFREAHDVPSAGWLELDGPLSVGVEDLPEAVAPSVVAARWLVQVHVGGAAKRHVQLGQRLARQLADAALGIVYDPQMGVVTWPRGQRRRPEVNRSGNELIRLIKLDWCFPGPLRSSDAATFLAVARGLMPEACPRRFGAFEPLQNQLAIDGDKAFCRLWDGDELAFWSAEWPCFGGSVSLNSRKRPPEDCSLKPADQLSISFDGRALHAEPRWSDAVNDLFVAIAQELRPFYAAATVQRNIRCSRNNRVGYGPEAERNVVLGRHWRGIPRFHTWLTWLGEPYRDVREALPEGPWTITPERGPCVPPASEDRGGRIEYRDGGVFMRLGVEPKDTDELEGWFPALPPELVRKSGQGRNDEPADVIPVL